MSTAARPETVRLWCATCHRFVDVVGRVHADPAGKFALTPTVHVTPDDWREHRGTHRRRRAAA